MPGRSRSDYRQGTDTGLSPPESAAVEWVVLDRKTCELIGTGRGQTAYQAFEASGINRHFSEVWLRTRADYENARSLLTGPSQLTVDAKTLEKLRALYVERIELGFPDELRILPAQAVIPMKIEVEVSTHPGLVRRLNGHKVNGHSKPKGKP
jgi:hypothetical protein